MKFVKSTLKKRVELLSLLSTDHPKHLVEVGVYKGYFAKQLAEQRDSNSTLHLVDPWNSPQCEGQMVGSEDDYNELQKYFSDKGNVRFYNSYSQHASNFFKNETLDFVYLDAEHTYDGVLGDIHIWFSKVKKGGILAGHDIFAPEHIGVTQAVMDHFEAVVFVIPAETCPFTSFTVNSTWYVIKES